MANDSKVGPPDLVITPGGKRRRDHVHLARVDLASAGTEELAIGPGGFRRKSRVHLRRFGISAVREEGESVRLNPRPEPGPPDAANWITYAGWMNQTGIPIRSLKTTWTVPPAPAKATSQLVYLFNGIEPADGSTIVQPVLQWGDSGTDEDGVHRTGQFWTAGSWVVPDADGHTYHTPHVRVSPGDKLVGIVTLLSRSAAGFVYNCEFDGIADSKLSTHAISELVWCVQTLEAYELEGKHTPPYDLDAASEYPAVPFTSFEAIQIVTDNPNPPGSWQAQNVVSSYGEHTSVDIDSSNGGAVTIHYGPVPARVA